jgi:hypothetical protein
MQLGFNDRISVGFDNGGCEIGERVDWNNDACEE